MTGQEEDMNIELIKQKVSYHFKNQIPIHCRDKNGWFRNGLIEEVSADFFILDEFFEGKIPIFFLELKYVMTYSERMRGKRDGNKS